MSRSSRDEVSTTTGSGRVRGSLLRRRSTSRPSTSGSFRSSSTTLGPSSRVRPAYAPVPNRKSSASAPSRTTWMRLATWCWAKACTASSTSSGLSSTSRISTGPSGTAAGSPPSLLAPTGVASFAHSEREGEGRAAVDGRLCPHAPAVAVHDALHDRQPDARPLVVLGAVQPLEDAEELVRVARVEAHPVVADEVDRLRAFVYARSYFDNRRLALPGVL